MVRVITFFMTFDGLAERCFPLMHTVLKDPGCDSSGCVSRAQAAHQAQPKAMRL